MNTLFQNVLTASFHGSIVILAVLLLRFFLGKAAPKKYLCYLWVLAGLRLLLPLDIQSQFSLQPQTPPGVIVRWEEPASVFRSPPQPVSQEPVSQAPVSGAEAGEASPSATEPARFSRGTAVPETPEESAPAPLKDSTPSLPLLPIVWAVVALSFLGYNLYCYQSLRGKVASARKISGGWEADGIETAFILGFIKPRIYIPARTPQKDRAYILAHERTHLDKGDHWIKMLGFLTLALHWFNPLVWLSYALMCKDIEMACDERVVQFMELAERKEYSTALLNCSSRHVLHAASPVAFGEVNVKNRIQSILAYRNPSFWAGFLSAMAVIFVTVCLVTNPMASDAASGSGSSHSFTVASQPPMEENPDWGVSILAEPTSGTSMNLYYSLSEGDTPWDGTPIEVEGTGRFSLEAWNGKTWEPLPARASQHTEDNDLHRVLDHPVEGYPFRDTIDWQALYGKLSEGDYRIVIPLSRDGETRPYCVWFHVYANALTGEEAEAFAKVEAALYRLADAQNYTATISDSSRQGVVMPSAVIHFSGASAQIDYYTGKYCYASYPCDAGDPQLAAWLDGFYPGETTYLSFAGKDGSISNSEISFTASWVDVMGQVHHQVHTYLLDDFGQLTGATLVTESTDGEGVLTKSERQLTVEYNSTYALDTMVSPQDPYAAATESPWNLYFRVGTDDDSPYYEGITASGAKITLRLGDNHIGVSDFTTDGSYWLEKWHDSSMEDRQWQPLLTRDANPTWGGDTLRIKNRTTEIDVDWTHFYGELSPGLYRMGKRFYSGSESIIQYAQFRVYPASAIVGEGGTEAMARVSDAIKKTCAGSYCVKSTNDSSHPLSQPTVDSIYWKWGDICVTDTNSYALEEPQLRRSAPVRQEDYGDVNLEDYYDPNTYYNRWAKTLPWDKPNFRIYFPQGDSVISDGEISFTGAYYRDPGSMAHYRVCFNADGSLDAIEKTSSASDGTEYTYLLSFEKVPEAEIKAVIDDALAREAAKKGGAL